MSLQCKEGKKFPSISTDCKESKQWRVLFPNVVHLMCVGGTPLAPLAETVILLCPLQKPKTL